MKDLILGLLFAVLGIAVIVMARSFSTIDGLQYGADLFPTLIGTGMLAGGVLLALSGVRQMNRARAAGEIAAQLPRPSWTVVLPVVAVIGYILLADTLGTGLTLALAMFMLFCSRGVRLLPAILTSVIAAAIVTFAFTRLLSVPLPLGPWGF
ncbi:tripartite tricarboxylate transporter TctB family protein [Pseudomonas matsuisoli]|uniref:DUF1468 domain-containing protein n=1 Tax=Pseudomonas matsuisoli TaxID=1515666 RepID=A0A917Q0N6_9PSED|nr:tripartite tricarboxylate transporter TctB family protein [Pseudomonas matsuisoli]GGK03969.1 hypothetical protein GCM10009304_32410 [Pseudomonas matsuisoli]